MNSWEYRLKKPTICKDILEIDYSQAQQEAQIRERAN